MQAIDIQETGRNNQMQISLSTMRKSELRDLVATEANLEIPE